MQANAKLQMVVGAALMAVAGGMLATLLLLGERPIAGGTRLTVRYARVANLKPGAEVRFFGRRAGVVLGVVEPKDNQLARVELLVRRRFARTLWSNARIYITATSVIGERFVDILPPADPLPPGPPVHEGQQLRGKDPPDLDAFFNRTYSVVTKVFALAKREGPTARALLAAVASLRQKVGALDLRRRLGNAGGKLIVAARDVQALRHALASSTHGGRAITRARRDIEKLVERYAARFGALAERAKKAVAAARAAAAVLPSPDQPRVRRAIARLKATAKRLQAARAQLAGVLRRLARGQGTLGRMLTDRELADDLKRASKNLKERPWRVLGKPPRDQAPRGVRRRPRKR